jgi:glycosyltransferase involved in cell wall biosynthesis
LKITHFGPSVLPVRFQLGGAIQRRMLELARNQVALGHRVTVYSADMQPGVENWHGVEIRNVVCKYRRLLFRDWEYLLKAVKDLGREPADVLHFHSLPEGSWISREVAARKFLSYDHFLFRRGKKTPLFWWYRRALRKFDCLLPVSEYCRRESTAYWDLEGVSVSVVYNGVNLGQFSPDPSSGIERRRMNGLEGKRVILYVGRVCEQKGTDILLEAYRTVKKRVLDAALVVAGPAGQFENVRDSSLTREIVEVGGLYLGAVREPELASVYNMCDVFVMPTRDLEMFGMAAVEAQACGKPVIASRHGGLPEAVTEASGLFFPVGNAAVLAEKLELLLEDKALSQAKSRAAQEGARRFAWPIIVRQLEEVYAA